MSTASLRTRPRNSLRLGRLAPHPRDVMLDQRMLHLEHAAARERRRRRGRVDSSALPTTVLPAMESFLACATREPKTAC